MNIYPEDYLLAGFIKENADKNHISHCTMSKPDYILVDEAIQRARQCAEPIQQLVSEKNQLQEIGNNLKTEISILKEKAQIELSPQQEIQEDDLQLLNQAKEECKKAILQEAQLAVSNGKYPFITLIEVPRKRETNILRSNALLLREKSSLLKSIDDLNDIRRKVFCYENDETPIGLENTLMPPPFSNSYSQIINNLKDTHYHYDAMHKFTSAITNLSSPSQNVSFCQLNFESSNPEPIKIDSDLDCSPPNIQVIQDILSGIPKSTSCSQRTAQLNNKVAQHVELSQKALDELQDAVKTNLVIPPKLWSLKNRNQATMERLLKKFIQMSQNLKSLKIPTFTPISVQSGTITVEKPSISDLDECRQLIQQLDKPNAISAQVFDDFIASYQRNEENDTLPTAPHLETADHSLNDMQISLLKAEAVQNVSTELDSVRTLLEKLPNGIRNADATADQLSNISGMEIYKPIELPQIEENPISFPRHDIIRPTPAPKEFTVVEKPPRNSSSTQMKKIVDELKLKLDGKNLISNLATLEARYASEMETLKKLEADVFTQKKKVEIKAEIEKIQTEVEKEQLKLKRVRKGIDVEQQKLDQLEEELRVMRLEHERNNMAHQQIDKIMEEINEENSRLAQEYEKINEYFDEKSKNI